MSQPSSPAAVFSPAAAEDLPVIAALAASIWRSHYPGIITHAQIDYMLGRMYALETMRREVADDGICYEVLRIEGRLVGFAAVGPGKEPGLFKLHKLYLHPDLQGRGLGSRLLGHMEAKAIGLGARRIELQVNKRNVSAIATYRRNGYRVAEEAVFDIGGGFVMDDFIMEKDLRPA